MANLSRTPLILPSAPNSIRSRVVFALQQGGLPYDFPLELSSDLLPNLPPFISRVCSGFGPGWGGLRTRSV
jgi:hypothetical protein